jgi:hypothetical protein
MAGMAAKLLELLVDDTGGAFRHGARVSVARATEELSRCDAPSPRADVRRAGPALVVTFCVPATQKVTSNAGGGAASWGAVEHERAQPIQPSVIAAAYLLAALCLMLPLAAIGSTFAGVVLWRRGLRGHGAAVVALGAACVAIGIAVLR